ncbi:MAG: hypothetical protein ABEJ82_08100 [Haloplanus sp.]
MVGPSSSDRERRVATARLRAGFVVLVGLSAGLVAVAGDATPAQALVAVAAGLVLGSVLLWFLLRTGRQWRGGHPPP